jgi:hypothetical protein
MKLSLTISLTILGALSVSVHGQTLCSDLYGSPCTIGTCCVFAAGDSQNDAILYCGNGVFENVAVPCPGPNAVCTMLPPPLNIASCPQGSPQSWSKINIG